MNSKVIYNHPVLFSFGVNHHTANVETREKIHISGDKISALLDIYKKYLAECFVLSTCNRTEVYGVINGGNPDIELYKKILIDYSDSSRFITNEHFYRLYSCGASHHLFKVASSVDSLIVGDSQILHQLKEAYQIASDKGVAGKIINQLCQKALHAGKRTKSETDLFEGAYSVSYAAVELASKIYGDFKSKNVLIIGAGETAVLTAEALLKKHINRLFITNRTEIKAAELLEKLRIMVKVEGEILSFDGFKNKLGDIDIVISSTGSPDFILNYDDLKPVLKKRRSPNPMLFIDIAVPRDIDPKISKFGNVFLKNIDDLNSIVDANYEKRMAVIPQVDKIINFEIIEFLSWYFSLPLKPLFEQVNTQSNGITFEHIKRLKGFVHKNISSFESCITSNGQYDYQKDLQSHSDLVKKIIDLKNKPVELI